MLQSIGPFAFGARLSGRTAPRVFRSPTKTHLLNFLASYIQCYKLDKWMYKSFN
jgi:hypothetical protein